MSLNRLYAGTINHHASDDEWANFHADVSDRSIHSTVNGFVRPDWVVDFGDREAMAAAFPAEDWDEIVCHHVLEHMYPAQGQQAIREFHRILKPGGVLDIEVPDVYPVFHAFLNGELDWKGLQQWVYGEVLANHEPGDTHKIIFTEGILRVWLANVGFKTGQREEAGWSIRLRAVKP